MKANLDLKIRGVRGGNPSWNDNKGSVVAFIDSSIDYIAVDAFKGSGSTYERRDVCEIEILIGDNVWKGSKADLEKFLF